jgi:predicted metal-dependent hydrolase
MTILREESSEAASMAKGVQLFNDCRYAEAHEEFETLWEATQGDDSDFYKGLIQACIALHHFQRGNLPGTAKLYSGHRKLLGPYAPSFAGVDVAALLRDMQRFLLPVVRSAPGSAPTFDSAARPRIAFVPADS